MTEYYYKSADDLQFVEIDTPRDGCWIHISRANTNDISALSKLTNIDESDLEDSLDRHEIPRIERFDNNTIIFTRHPATHETGLYTATLTIIMTPNYFVTISPYDPSLIRDMFKERHELTTQMHSKLLSRLFYKTTQQFTREIKRVRTEVLLQEKDMIGVDSDDIAALTKHEEVLNQYMSCLSRINRVISSIRVSEEEQDLLEDLYHAVNQSEEICQINLKSMKSLRDSYQIIFTNNMHKTIKLLTSLTIILSIPTMIASVYGMNIALPFEKYEYAFPIILAITLFLLVISLFIFHRKKWL